MGIGLVIPLKWVFILGIGAIALILVTVEHFIPGTLQALRGLLPF